MPTVEERKRVLKVNERTPVQSSRNKGQKSNPKTYFPLNIQANCTHINKRMYALQLIPHVYIETSFQHP